MSMAWLSPKKDIRPLAALVSVIFSLIVLAYNEPSNGDAATYIRTAIAYGEHGITGAIFYYRWPFFSIVLYYFTAITHLSYMSAGLLLNNFFAALLVVSFISVVKQLGGHYRLQCIAALVILLFPYLNHFRDNVLRDTGYWAFFMCAIWGLIRYTTQFRFRHALLWNLCVLLATSFRIEGTAFALFTPLFLLLKPRLRLWPRVYITLKLYLVPFVFSLLALGYLLASGKISLLLESRFNDIPMQLTVGVERSMDALNNAAGLMQQHVLGYFGRHDAMTILLFGLTGIVVIAILKNLGIVYTLLACHGLLTQRQRIAWQGKMLFIFLCGINISLIAMFTSQHLFISQRYTMLLCLLLLFPVVYSVDAIIQNCQRARHTTSGKPFILTLLILGLCYNLIAGLGHFGTSKAYLVQAGKWLAEHADKNDIILVNSAQIYLYANREGPKSWSVHQYICAGANKEDYNIPPSTENFIELLKNSPVKYNYVAIEVNNNDKAQLEEQVTTALDVREVTRTQNNKGDHAIIYKVLSQP